MTMQEPAITPDLIAAHGLSADEYDRILEIIGREPTFTELGIFSAMWNEHCSYKSSKKWLRTLPTDGPQVICGPGENAGVVDIGDGQAVIFKFSISSGLIVRRSTKICTVPETSMMIVAGPRGTCPPGSTMAQMLSSTVTPS